MCWTVFQQKKKNRPQRSLPFLNFSCSKVLAIFASEIFCCEYLDRPCQYAHACCLWLCMRACVPLCLVYVPSSWRRRKARCCRSRSQQCAINIKKRWVIIWRGSRVFCLCTHSFVKKNTIYTPNEMSNDCRVVSGWVCRRRQRGF